METRRIPLFPLNTVLFPGMPLPLHIFEPRYQQMIRGCLEGDRTFGVCLIRSGEEVGGPADPHSVGTTCQILAVTPLGEGRMNLVTVGRERFRVVRLFHEQPFMEAEIEPMPEQERGVLGDVPDRVREAAIRYVHALLELAGEPERTFRLPADPEQLSYIVAAVLQVPTPVKQALLETRSTADRLRRQLEILEQGVRAEAAREKVQRKVARPFRAGAEDVTLN